MADCTRKITEKEVLPHVNLADTLPVVKDGRLFLAPTDSLGEQTMINEDDNSEKYTVRMVKRNGHLVLVFARD